MCTCLSSDLSRGVEDPLCRVRFSMGNDPPEASITTIRDFMTSKIRCKVSRAWQTRSKHNAMRLPTNNLNGPRFEEGHHAETTGSIQSVGRSEFGQTVVRLDHHAG